MTPRDRAVQALATVNVVGHLGTTEVEVLDALERHGFRVVEELHVDVPSGERVSTGLTPVALLLGGVMEIGMGTISRAEIDSDLGAALARNLSLAAAAFLGQPS